MIQTIKAIVDERHALRLLAPVHLDRHHRALVTILANEPSDAHETALMSETSLTAGLTSCRSQSPSIKSFDMKQKPSNIHPFGLTVLTYASLVAPVFAVVSIDFATVSNAGNAADASTGSLFGAVAYAYQIGKYEVTNAQYTEFLNAVDPGGANANGIYNTNMGINARGGITYNAESAAGAKYTIRASMGEKPVNYVS